jgi:hypothetical protein
MTTSHINSEFYGMDEILETKKTSFIHFVTNQEEYDNMVGSYKNSDENTDHLIVIHAHGSNKSKDADTLKNIESCPGSNYIFINELPYVMNNGKKENKKMYILAVSCYWNLKYNPEFAGQYCLPKPTISLAPTETSRLPYLYKRLEKRVKELPNNFDEIYMRNWFINLKANFDYNLDCHEVYMDGELQKYGRYELIYSD